MIKLRTLFANPFGMELGGVGRDRARELLLTTEGSVELALEILDAEVSLGSR